MANLDYLAILKESWRLTWDNKRLWWFGLLLGGGSGISLNFPTTEQTDAAAEAWIEKATRFVSEHESLLWSALIFLTALLIAFLILRIMAYGGIIHALKDLTAVRSFELKKSFRAGWHFWARIFSLLLLSSLLSLMLFAAVILPIIYLFHIGSFWLGGISSLFGIMLLLLAITLISFVEKYSSFYMVSSDLSLPASVLLGYQLFLKNILPSIVFGICLIPIALVLSLGLVAILVLLAGICSVVGWLFFPILAWKSVWLFGAIGALSAASLLIFVRSVFGTFIQASWYLFFQKIAAAPAPEPVPAPSLEEKLAAPEEA